ncbi:hypothetical protein [Microbulbifer halophilus]|uniref:Coiled coil domain-containing protein n=2 Tax=Microbulbifer halophilus TaxID=453963 RepID=A0ABW5EBH6_9GAMM|nr:hypothetical protein [Microbulbifer halophilus]MCW8125260.1 hypothetical protein [Microbulbifer halophilus]
MSEREEKTAYQQKMAARLKEWNAEIDKLQAKAEEAGTDAEIKYRDQLSELRTKRDALREKLNHLQGQSGDAWDEVKAGVESAWGELKQSIERARDRMR